MSSIDYLNKTGLAQLWSIIKGKLDGKADATHSHTKADISDFPTALKNPNSLTIKTNGATYKTYNGGTAQTVDLTPSLIGASADGHTHGTADIDGLTSALNSKASASHSHAISEVSGLQSELDGKAEADHTHRKQVTNVSVATTAWVSSSTYTSYPYQATVSVTGATSTMLPEVVFALTEAESGNFAPIAQSASGGVIIYAKTAPTAAITLPAVTCWA